MPRTLAILLNVALLAACAARADAAACVDCHGEHDVIPEGKFASAASFAGTPHKKLACTDCHADFAGKEEGHPPKLKAKKVDCSTCHEDQADHYAKSIHGLAAKRGEPDAPRCQDCHGTHRILPPADPNSRANPRNIEQVCVRCHTDPAVVARGKLSPPQHVKDYELSIHWASREKVGGVAYCTSCHGAHSVLPSSDPNSETNRSNVAQTCGKCHDAIYTQFKQSIHGQGYLARNANVPGCTDCHGGHKILGKADANSPTYPTHIAAMCLRCHDKELISPALGAPGMRGKTYFSSYHGIASSMGDATVANCASCHGSHNIRKSSDPLSTVNPANIPHTCGACHPGAGVNFSLGKIHVMGPTATSWIAGFIGNVYTLVIAGVVAGLFGLIALDLYGRFRRRKRGRTHTP
jgi:hypothetical protein